MTKLDELRRRYSWFEDALRVAHADGKIDSESVRFWIQERQPILVDDEGEPILDNEGELQYDWDAEPYYFGTAQAWSYVGDPPSGTVAGTMEMALPLLDQADRATVLDAVCEDLSHEHAEMLAFR